MLEFLIDNIFVIFGGRVFQQTVGIPMGTNCAPLLADLFLYSYEEDFIQGLLKKNEKKLARSFNFTFRYIDNVPSLNNASFGDFVDRVYPIKLEIKDTTDTDRSASYIDLHFEIDSEGRLRTKLYDKRDYFNFPIVNFPFICSNIPAAPAYGVYISQLIRYSRACGSYQDFLDRRLLLTRKLLNQGFLLVKLKSSLRKFYGRHHDLVDVMEYLLTLPEHLSSPPVFSGVRVTRSLVLYVCFVDRCLSFYNFSFIHCVVCSSSIYGF